MRYSFAYRNGIPRTSANSSVAETHRREMFSDFALATMAAFLALVLGAGAGMVLGS
jgi:hypothetical protein